MIHYIKIIALTAFLAVLSSSGAYAQCSGQPGSGLVCGNSTASTTLPTWATQTALLDRAFGSVQGTILNRGASVWAETPTPSLGRNGGTGGSLTLNGSSTGSAVIGVKAAAGSSIFNLPVGNGTLNQALVTDGSGNTSWTTAGTGTVTNVIISTTSPLSNGGTCSISTTGTCTIAYNPPYLQAYLSANQTGVADNTLTLININTVSVDNRSFFNTSTHLYTPTLAGYYLVTVKVRCQVATLMTACVADVLRNGSSFARSTILPGSSATSDSSVTAIVQINGTTDTISAGGLVIGSGGSDQFNGGTAPQITYMTITYAGN